MTTRLSGKMLKRAAAVFLLAGILAWAWFDVARDLVIPKRWGVVEPGMIYRSGQISPPLIKKVLEKHGIRVLIDLTGEETNNPAQIAETQACEELRIKRFRLPLSGDGTGDIHQYAKALYETVKAKERKEPVLLHCSAGTMRAGAATYFYRVLVQRESPEKAGAEIKSYGWRPRKDKVLREYINANIGELAGLLEQMGVITNAPPSAALAVP